jgi:hypothetical protein
MGDDITIGVTEIVNNIEVTAQPNDQVIDIEVIDNSDDVTLNVTPNVIEVNINKGSSYARWGSIFGNLTDQTDLTNALFNKADLVDGKVPAYQLPSFVDDVIEVANFSALPTVGEIGKIYVTLDNNKIYRWSGSIYIEIAANQAVWGSITGTLSNQTDLQNALNLKANDNEVVKLAGSQTITGEKTFSAIRTNVNGTLVVKSGTPTGVSFSSFTLNHLTLGITNSGTTYNQNLIFPSNSSNSYTFPNTSGTLALTSQLHDAVTLGTANGLSLSGQVLSLGLSGTSSTGALSSTDWNTFNNKLSSLSGAVLTTTNQSIAGIKTFTDNIVSNTFYSSKIISGGYIPDAGYSNMYSNDLMLTFNQMNAAGTAVTTFNFVYPTSNTLRTYNLPNSDGTLALTSQLHNAVTIGTANGLSLSNQVLSLGLASASTNGALSSSNWTTFNNKQNALNGTGFVKISGTTISYDNNTYALDSAVVTLATDQTISGQKTFLNNVNIDAGINLDDAFGLYWKTNVGAIETALAGIGQSSSGLNFFTGSSLSTPKMVINSGGNVGIGTTSPANKLSVFNTLGLPSSSVLSEAILLIQDSGSNRRLGIGSSTSGQWLQSSYPGVDGITSTLLLNPSGGNVGIGTSTPARTLHVLGQTGIGTVLKLEGATGTTTYLQLSYNGATNSQSGYIGYDSSSNMSLFTNDTERMRITSGGLVGIGTTSPAVRLDVLGSSEVLRLRSNATANYFTFFNSSNSQIGDIGYDGRDTDILSIWNGLNGGILFGTNASERMRITSGGNVLINATSNFGVGKLEITYNGQTQTALDIKTTHTDGNNLRFFNSSGSVVGSIYSTTTVTSYNTSSDYRLKQDLKPINGLDLVSQIKVYDYAWKVDKSRSCGVLAHELQEVIPQAVTGEKDAEQMQSVDYSKLVPILVQAIQEQQKQIEELKTLINK